MNSVDAEFGQAVREAFEAFRPYANHFRKQEQQNFLRPLIEYLRSSNQMGVGEREYLADLLAGEMGSQRGHPSLKTGEKARRYEICERVVQIKAQWRRSGRKWPFHQEAIEAVHLEIAKGPRSGRATAKEIESWMKGLSPSSRESFRRRYPEAFGKKSDQI